MIDLFNAALRALLYIGLGLVGAVLHWAKKRYWDRTTNTNLIQYVTGCKEATVKAVKAIVLAELSLSYLQAADTMSLQELLGAITAGYTFDSGLNKAPDKE